MGQKIEQINSETQPASATLKVTACICFIIGLSSFWSLSQFHHLDNTRNGIRFFFLFAILGLIISSPFYLLIYRNVPDLRESQKVDKAWRTGISGLGIGLIFLTPAIASYINRTHLVGPDDCNTYQIINKSYSGGRHHAYHLFVLIDNYDERLTVFRPYWETLQKGQPIKLCLRKGILGFQYIKIDE